MPKEVQRLHEAGGYICSAVMDNNRPLHIARRSSRIDPIIDNGLSDQFSIIESIFENRLSIIGSTSDVQGSIIVHDGTPYQTGRYIAKIAAGGIKATGRGFAKFLAKLIESGSVARKPWSGKQSKRN